MYPASRMLRTLVRGGGIRGFCLIPDADKSFRSHGLLRPGSWAIPVLLVTAAVFIKGSHAAPENIGYQIKAAYIYNILQFVSFPDTALSADGALNVCVLGEDRFGGALEEIDGTELPQGRLKVVRLGSYGAGKSFDDCNALYVAQSERRFIKSIMEALDTRSILTIGELPSFIGNGGLIELFVQDDRVRFRVNEKLAKETDFRVAAQLIQLGVRR